MKLFSAISILILVSLFGTVRNTPCEGTGISCQTIISSILCDITADNGTTASYLANLCTRQSNPAIVQHYDTFYGFTNDRITLDVGPGVILISLSIEGDNNEIAFNNTQPDVIRVRIYSPVSINASQTILSNFPNLVRADLNYVRMDGFPLFYSNLEEMRLNNLTLPSVVTIQSSIFNLPGLTELDLAQSADEEWFRLADDSFDNALSIVELEMYGLRHFRANQFVRLVNLTELSLRVDYPNTTFETDAFAGLNTMTFLRIVSSPNVDFIYSYTFPNLESIRMRTDGLTTLDQDFFQRQKALTTLDVDVNPFNCYCDMAWVSHVADNLGWRVDGTCSDGNLIKDSSNYVKCRESSFLCFNSTYICPSDSTCVNTVDNAYCECDSRARVQPGDECSGAGKFTYQSTLSVVLLIVLLLL